uniref:Uncharacterized protein n=1 Tax=Rhizophora mucronata TaxID=61149 RepID=A0A2P2N0C9_RHIMU
MIKVALKCKGQSFCFQFFHVASLVANLIAALLV